jgi:hypothetical protein
MLVGEGKWERGEGYTRPSRISALHYVHESWSRQCVLLRTHDVTASSHPTPTPTPTQALKKHPGDRPSVMEMLHHAWIRSYQRRNSVVVPAGASRRRSSQMYPNPLPGGPPLTEQQFLAAGGGGVGGAVGSGRPLQQGAGAGGAPVGGGFHNHPPNLDTMTPEEIEQMIQRLQVSAWERERVCAWWNEGVRHA